MLNFAVAKVRYRANTQDAIDVRMFFRTFNTMVSDLSYTTNPAADVQNYRRNAAGTAPLLGLNRFFSGAGNQLLSIPYFAEPRIDSSTQSMTAQCGHINCRAFSIERQIVGRVWTCAMTEHTTTREAATGGDTA